MAGTRSNWSDCICSHEEDKDEHYVPSSLSPFYASYDLRQRMVLPIILGFICQPQLT